MKHTAGAVDVERTCRNPGPGDDVRGHTGTGRRAAPQNARPLSQLIAIVEQNDDVAYIEDVDWDDDGYYEVEYRTRNGGDREIRIDPVSGEIRSD